MANREIKRQTELLWMIWLPALIGMGMVSLSPVLPEIRKELGFSASAIGVTLFLASSAAVLVSGMAGSYSDRVGKVRLMQLALLVASMGSFLIVITRQGWSFAAGYILFFTGISTMAALAKGMLSDLFPQKRADSLTRSAIFWNSGSVIACIGIALFFFFQAGWRAIFVLLAVLYLSSIATLNQSQLVIDNKNKQLHSPIKSKFHINALAMNIFITMFFLESAITFQIWLTTYLSASGYTTPVLNALSMSAFWLLFLLGVGFKRYLLKSFDELMIIIGSAVTILISLVIFYMSSTIMTKVLAALVVAFMYASSPVLLTAVALNSFPTFSGSITGMLQGTMILGGLITQPLQGIVIDRIGEGQGVLLPIFSIFLALVFAFLLRLKLSNQQVLKKEEVNEP